VARQWSSLSCGRKDTGSWRGMFFKRAPAILGLAPDPEPEISEAADLCRKRVWLVTEDRVAHLERAIRRPVGHRRAGITRMREG
jgi:hypothetical protein